MIKLRVVRIKSYLQSTLAHSTTSWMNTEKKFQKLEKYVDDHNILDLNIVNEDEPDEGNFQHVNFTDYHMYSLTNLGPKSKIISTLLKRIVADNSQNPIYKAYLESRELGLENCPICLNYEFLFDEQKEIRLKISLFKQSLRINWIISLRALLNFFYDVIVPIGYKWENLEAYKKQLSKLKTSELLNAVIPNYLFEHPELSVVFEKMSKLDPCSLRYSERLGINPID